MARLICGCGLRERSWFKAGQGLRRVLAVSKRWQTKGIIIDRESLSSSSRNECVFDNLLLAPSVVPWKCCTTLHPPSATPLSQTAHRVTNRPRWAPQSTAARR
ncbi:unnamed protein product [Malus baccata var. baccata]